jgi:hypothetical protein
MNPLFTSRFEEIVIPTGAAASFAAAQWPAPIPIGEEPLFDFATAKNSSLANPIRPPHIALTLVSI